MRRPPRGILVVTNEGVEDILVRVEGEGFGDDRVSGSGRNEVPVGREVVVGERFGFRSLVPGCTAGRCQHVKVWLIGKSIQTPKTLELNSPGLFPTPQSPSLDARSRSIPRYLDQA